MNGREEYVSASWLRKKVDFEDLEYEITKDDIDRFKDQMLEGDEIWRFSSGSSSWQNLAGRAGYALVRDGKAIDGVVSVMN